MIPKFYNISDAMAAKRNTDKIVAILNNRFCLAYSQYTDGTYSKDISIHFLFKDVVYTLTHLECFKRAFCIEMNKYKGVKCIGFIRNFSNEYKIKVVDYRKSNQRYRQLDRALKQYVENKLENYELISKWI